MKGRLVFVLLLAASLWLQPEPILRQGESPTDAESVSSSAGLLVVDLADGTSPKQAADFADRYGLDLRYTSPLSMDEALMVAQVDDLQAAWSRVRNDPAIEVVEPVVEFSANAYPNDPLWSKQWNLKSIGVALGWRYGSGQGASVAVLDTGVSQVDDLQGVRWLGGHSFVHNTADPTDDHGHGTHVAGTIFQQTDNRLAVAGIAPNAGLWAYKVLDAQGRGRSDWIAAAVDEAVDRGADVINLSLGGPHSAVLHRAAEKAVEAGVIVVAAAGNTGRSGVSCPAHAVGVLGVGAVGPKGKRAPYSSFGKGVELAGPGGDLNQADGGVLQQTIDGKGGSAVQAFQGTSMAAPHVSGAAAVLRGRGLEARQSIDLLLQTASSVGVNGSKLGHGRVRLGAAIRRALFRTDAPRFLIAGILAGVLANMAGLSVGAQIVSGLSAAMFGSGLFFLPLLPLHPNLTPNWLAVGAVYWPEALVSAQLAGFPIWLSALCPLAVAFVLGPSLRVGLLAGGFCVGFGCALLQGAASGALNPWWLGFGLDRVWLSVNGTLCLLAAAAVFGMQKMRRTAA